MLKSGRVASDQLEIDRNMLRAMRMKNLTVLCRTFAVLRVRVRVGASRTRGSSRRGRPRHERPMAERGGPKADVGAIMFTGTNISLISMLRSAQPALHTPKTMDKGT